MTQAERQSFGIGKGEYIADTAARNGKNYQVLQMIESTVIAAITAPQLTGAASLVGKTLPAGLQIHTNVTALTLTSGSCIAYDAQ
jgi:hypothetical protein